MLLFPLRCFLLHHLSPFSTEHRQFEGFDADDINDFVDLDEPAVGFEMIDTIADAEGISMGSVSFEAQFGKDLASVVSLPSGKKWIADKLAVVAESKEVAGDMISETVLDQSLQAVKKISQEDPTACLQADTLMVVLSYLDFFSTGRVALATAGNMCKKLPLDVAAFGYC
ncbi:hypothetical protein CQW23_07637 [Capsicum baccatum]|uniref:Uncharacterized protein n=1 Tax=Capsicum baccatum TaxID=33114 RepID=A0A2G2X6N1_CAPBA|nr:hypothetical protein CQW23_07637 [Capsicum baccatum]